MSKQLREPPPALFLGPPSQNASHVSLPGVGPVPQPPNPSLNPSKAPLIRQHSLLGPARATVDGPVDVPPIPTLPRTALPRQQQEAEGRKQADRTDALWAEMQSTLEEVELSAVNGTHVFGPDHSKALEGLRAAQIELAQAWARSEADDAVETAEKESKALSGPRGVTLGSEGKSLMDTMGSTARTGPASGPGSDNRPGSSGLAPGTAERMGSKLEAETEADILLARKRREANDKYFQRVNEGVLDVVAKLEEVANAMRAVEQESRDIWADNESAGTSVRD